MPPCHEPFPFHPHPAPAPAAGAAAADAGRIGRIGLLTLALGFGGFLLWAAFAPLDEGVPSAGMVAIDTKRKAVQHLSGGIIEKVVVREGDRVHAGQLLIRLDSALARANHEASRQRYLGLRAMQARLTAEHLGAQSLVFHDDLQAAAADPLIRQQMHTQEQLFDTRRQLLRSDLQSIEESIQGQRGMYEAYVRMLRSRQSQQESLDTELNSLRGLVAEGYAPRNRQHELERLVADAHSGMADLLGNTVRAQRSMAELRQRAFSRQQEQRREVQTQLAEVEREVLAEQEKLKALADELGRMDIKSPADGQVVGLAAQTVGGVVQPGEKLMDIVPLNAPLLLESQVAPHLIDRVHAELPVDVRFSSFAHSPQLVVEGRVQSVSSDLLTDAQTLASYYLARVEVTPRACSAWASASCSRACRWRWSSRPANARC
ncbi:HlyD family type I secretion periplasmic adaptor subunit [Comamonas endophytica]|uniref:HlyD family type I secretion periplasmic adaptor subunit n=1 Tax=Comamonas endophytica TaxID=2949090 RepID=UPI0036244DA5